MRIEPEEKMWKKCQRLLEALEIEAKDSPEGQYTELQTVSEVLFLAVEVMYLSFPKFN